jgi:hypothetical protein
MFGANTIASNYGIEKQYYSRTAYYIFSFYNSKVIENLKMSTVLKKKKHER